MTRPSARSASDARPQAPLLVGTGVCTVHLRARTYVSAPRGQPPYRLSHPFSFDSPYCLLPCAFHTQLYTAVGCTSGARRIRMSVSTSMSTPCSIPAQPMLSQSPMHARGLGPCTIYLPYPLSPSSAPRPQAKCSAESEVPPALLALESKYVHMSTMMMPQARRPGFRRAQAAAADDDDVIVLPRSIG